MSMKMVCNRCNKVKEDGETFDRIDYTIKSVNPYKDFTYDLCPECSKKFGIFLDGGEVEEDHYKDSKPCAVVIHKMANGHYAIENAPEKKPDEPSIDKDNPDSCVKSHKVTCPTTGETITVPDSEPWSSSGETRLCSNCVHELRPGYLEPCKSCEKHSNWKPWKEKKDDSE